MRLTSVQREVILALIDLYHKSQGDAVKGESIAKIISKNPGTIRNQMQSLRSLGLVEGVPGPKGGYRPTVEGYKILNFEAIDKMVTVPIVHKDTLVEELSVTRIELPSISSPDKCSATIHLMGAIKKLNVNDIIRIGPTPVNKLIMRCRVVGRDDISNVLLVDVLEMISIPKEKVIFSATKGITFISSDDSVKNAAKVFVKENIRGAPVLKNGSLVGIISTVDITKALAEGRENLKVKDIMSTKVHTIKSDELLSKAIEEMEDQNISRLIVVNKNGDAEGIITHTDILCRIVNLCKLVPNLK
ncbi:MAG: CBS domain-containing protein [Candidatus Hydrothermarchaeaceae archaeon]